MINGDVAQIMSNEGRIWHSYYKSFNKILKNFKMDKREIRPPTTDQCVDFFWEFSLYVSALSEIITHICIHQLVSYMNPERRFSLALDIADIFKPVIVERVIFKLVNNKMLTEKDFNRDVGVAQ